MHQIIIRLPANRDYVGTLKLEDAKGKLLAGPFAVCGRARDELARANGNPGRIAILPFGDMPLGEYQIVQIIKSGPGTLYNSDEFGSAGLVFLQPRHGEAVLADANGRFVFFIQGGALARNGALRPTEDGSLRLSNRDQRRFIRALGRVGAEACRCIVTSSGSARHRVSLAANSGRAAHVAPARDGAAPSWPLTAGAAAAGLAETSRRSWLRTMLIAAGAFASVSSLLRFFPQTAFGEEGGTDYSTIQNPPPVTVPETTEENPPPVTVPETTEENPPNPETETEVQPTIENPSNVEPTAVQEPTYTVGPDTQTQPNPVATTETEPTVENPPPITVPEPTVENPPQPTATTETEPTVENPPPVTVPEPTYNTGPGTECQSNPTHIVGTDEDLHDAVISKTTTQTVPLTPFSTQAQPTIQSNPEQLPPPGTDTQATDQLNGILTNPNESTLQPRIGWDTAGNKTGTTNGSPPPTVQPGGDQPLDISKLPPEIRDSPEAQQLGQYQQKLKDDQAAAAKAQADLDAQRAINPNASSGVLQAAKDKLAGDKTFTQYLTNQIKAKLPALPIGIPAVPKSGTTTAPAPSQPAKGQ